MSSMSTPETEQAAQGDEDIEIAAAAEEEAAAPQVRYAIHSTVRGRHNRTARAQVPGRRRMSQHIGHNQQRLVRGRPVVVSEDYVIRNLADLKARQAEHSLEVKTLDGRLVNLETMEVAAPPAPAPKPHPLPDSAANDPPAGEFIPPYTGDPTGSSPVFLPDGQEPALLSRLESEAESEGSEPPVEIVDDVTDTTGSPPPVAGDAADKTGAKKRGGRRNQ